MSTVLLVAIQFLIVVIQSSPSHHHDHHHHYKGVGIAETPWFLSNTSDLVIGMEQLGMNKFINPTFGNDNRYPTKLHDFNLYSIPVVLNTVSLVGDVYFHFKVGCDTNNTAVIVNTTMCGQFLQRGMILGPTIGNLEISFHHPKTYVEFSIGRNCVGCINSFAYVDIYQVHKRGGRGAGPAETKRSTALLLAPM